MAAGTGKLTDKQSKALEFIRSSVESCGTAPTLRELCSHMGYSAIGSAQDVVAALRKKGFLQTPEKQSARSLILSDKAASSSEDSSRFDPNTFIINCLGRVPAGNPIEAVEERIGTLRMSIGMFSKPYPKSDNLFAVQASGQSMVGSGILDGDWLVVSGTKEAAVGEIVVARIGDDSTIKRLQRDDDGWYLKPENPSLEDIRASEDEPFEIVGKVVALQRTLM